MLPRVQHWHSQEGRITDLANTHSELGATTWVGLYFSTGSAQPTRGDPYSPLGALAMLCVLFSTKSGSGCSLAHNTNSNE